MDIARNRKALVLVVVLWTIVLLMVIVAAAGGSARIDSKFTRTQNQQVRYSWAYRAGLETAIAVLKEDLTDGDGLTDSWNDNELDFNDIPLHRCSVSVVVIDESSKLNINTATKEQMMALPDMSEGIAEAIIDWRDNDNDALPTGAESGYYRNLPIGYEIRNGDFRTIRELLRVKNITERLLLGEDTNFNGRLDYNEDDGDETKPIDNEDQNLDPGWIEYLTCYSYCTNTDAQGNERVNINEASQEDLEKKLDIKKSHAKWIVENRERQNNKKYGSIADLIDDKSPQKPKDSDKEDNDEAKQLDLQTFQKVADKITVENGSILKGRTNINTASETVLAALLGDDDKAESIARDIVDHRKGLAGPMTSIAEIMSVSSVNVKTFKKLAEHITTRSPVYTIRCFVRDHTKDQTKDVGFAEAVVDRSNNSAKIYYWYEGVPD